MTSAAAEPMRIGNIARCFFGVTAGQIMAAQHHMRMHGCKMGEAFVHVGAIGAHELDHLLAKQQQLRGNVASTSDIMCLLHFAASGVAMIGDRLDAFSRSVIAR